ncbi:MAG: flagellar motor switch phosphatase FliY [Syntrophomonas sp.]|nr:flagellar motor switch phosphatase FliY [Syntrophomonas sp.]
MNDGILSQEEIDALLTGGSPSSTVDSASSSEPASSTSSISLSDFEKDTLGEVGNISMGTAATTLSTLLRQKVSITTPDVSITNPEELQLHYPLPFLVVEVSYTQGLSGSNILVIKEEDASIIADLMMGGDGLLQEKNLGELELSAVGEAMNQMMGSATTSLSSMFNRRIDIAPPKLTIMDMGKEYLQLSTSFEDMVKIKFKMEIENLINSEIMQIIPMEAVEHIMSILMGSTAEESSPEAVMEEPTLSRPIPEANPTAVAAPRQVEAAITSPPHEPIYNQAFAQSPREMNVRPQFAVQPVQFAPLHESDMIHSHQNLDLIMDVPLDVSVELGKTKKTIREILELNQGAIIQLDKLAGEPVDLLVNGKLIAKGEVVVIDENYGIRITTIISPIDRMNKLQ